jgi:hypothetical protein
VIATQPNISILRRGRNPEKALSRGTAPRLEIIGKHTVPSLNSKKTHFSHNKEEI